MQTLEEQKENINAYLKKLRRIISMENSFSFGNSKIVSKSRIDDIICCVQASYPDAFRDYIKKNGPKSLETQTYFLKLVEISTKKFFLSQDHYIVSLLDFDKCLSAFSQTMKRETQKVVNSINS